MRYYYNSCNSIIKGFELFAITFCCSSFKEKVCSLILGCPKAITSPLYHLATKNLVNGGNTTSHSFGFLEYGAICFPYLIDLIKNIVLLFRN